MRIRTQPSLSREFTLIALFIVFILLLVSVWIVWRTYEYNGDRVLKQLENESLRIDRALIVEIENASYILESVGRQIAAMKDPSLQDIDQLLKSFDRRDYAKNSFFSWANEKQMLVASSVTGVLPNPIDISDRDYVKKAITKPWALYLGRPMEGRISNKWVLPLSIGVADKQGNYLGVLILSLDISNLSREISKVIKEQGISFAITNLSLTLLTQDSADVDFFSRHFDITRLATIDFDSAPTGVISRARLFSGDDIYAYYERSGKYPYVIFLGYDAKKNAESLRSVLLPRLLQLSVIAGFLLWVLWDVRRRIIQPVVHLSDLVRSIVRGEHVSQKPEPGPIEIEALHQEILRLYQFLNERRRLELELRSKNNELLKIKESAEITNQVKADFYAQVGQQLSEPIEQIQAQAETLKDQHFGPLPNAKYQQNASEIYAISDQLLQVLADIRSITEAESGLMMINDSTIDLTQLTQKTVRQFKEREGQSFDIQIDYPHDLPPIVGDELRMRQLFLTLLHESASQLTAGDMIRISAADKGEELHILFGYGREPEHNHHRSPSRKPDLHARPQRNQGLSIALTRLLVAMHQGSMETRTLPDKTFQILIRWPESRIVRENA